MSTSIIRGRTLTFNRKPNSINDVESYNYIEDGAILIQGGTIKKIGLFKDIKSIQYFFQVQLSNEYHPPFLYQG